MKVITAYMLRWCLFTPLFMWKIQVNSLWTVTERKDRKVCKLDGELKILFKKKINIVNQINKHRSSSRLVKEISTITKILPRGNRSYFGFAWCQFLLLLLFQFSIQGCSYPSKNWDHSNGYLRLSTQKQCVNSSFGSMTSL